MNEWINKYISQDTKTKKHTHTHLSMRYDGEEKLSPTACKPITQSNSIHFHSYVPRFNRA